MDADDPLQRLRELCLSLPEVTERVSHGEPTWFVQGRKSFVTFADRHHDDVQAFWCAAPPAAQGELVASAPDRFFVPPYVGGRGWLGVRLDVPLDWSEMAELVEDAYREIAPAQLVARLPATPNATLNATLNASGHESGTRSDESGPSAR
jgi:hypothetical protein